MKTPPTKPFLCAAVLSCFRFVLLPIAQSSGSSSSSSSGFGLCFNEAQICQDNVTCEACLGSWTTSNSSESCEDTYGVVLATSTDTICDGTGVRICCGFETGTAEACMQNEPMAEYWSCIMGHSDCTLDHMPCNDASFASDVNGAAGDGRVFFAAKGGVVLLAGFVVPAVVAAGVGVML